MCVEYVHWPPIAISQKLVTAIPKGSGSKQSSLLCPGGGIGRRDRLKIYWWQHHESSTLSRGTIIKIKCLKVLLFEICQKPRNLKTLPANVQYAARIFWWKFFPTENILAAIIFIAPRNAIPMVNARISIKSPLPVRVRPRQVGIIPRQVNTGNARSAIGINSY